MIRKIPNHTENIIVFGMALSSARAVFTIALGAENLNYRCGQFVERSATFVATRVIAKMIFGATPPYRRTDKSNSVSGVFLAYSAIHHFFFGAHAIPPSS